MKKMIIPRRDHEVYFIPIPETLRKKQLERFTLEQLDKLHPGFSSASAYEFKSYVFNKGRWVMATVMNAETLAEYRILNRGAAFFTNTSIAVNGKDFLSGGVNTVNDELIGFDAEKNVPVSYPLEAGKTGDSEKAELSLKRLPARYGVFRKKKPHWFIPLLLAVFALAFPFFFFSGFYMEKGGEILIPEEVNKNTAEEAKYLPEAAEILAAFAADIIKSGGKMSRWQYNENSEPYIIIQTQGIDVLSVYNIFAHYDFLYLQDIRNVSYIDGEPNVTVNLNAGYAAFPAAAFSAQRLALPVIADMTGELIRREVSIVSETLPGTGNDLYTLNYTAKDRELVRSLEIISDYCGKYPLRVRSMDISVNNEKNLFTVVCSLTQTDKPNQGIAGLEGDKEIIPLAFGYRETSSVIDVAAFSEEESPQPLIIGSIRDSSGQMIFYRETTYGKISIRENL